MRQQQQADSTSIRQQGQQQEQSTTPLAAHSRLLERLQRTAGLEQQDLQKTAEIDQKLQEAQQQEAEQQEQEQLADLQQRAEQLVAENASLREAQARAEALQERMARSQQAEQLKQVRHAVWCMAAGRANHTFHLHVTHQVNPRSFPHSSWFTCSRIITTVIAMSGCAAHVACAVDKS
jgi:hypothetical protein